MLYLKNNLFQDLSSYIPDGFKENSTTCIQTWYTKKDSELMIGTIDHLAKEVFSNIDLESNRVSFLPLPESFEIPSIGPRILWTNKYGPNQRTGFHTHSDPLFLKTANHFAIYVLAVGSQTETLSFIDSVGIQQDIAVSPGDLFICHHSQLHGALPVKEYLCAMMFKINV